MSTENIDPAGTVVQGYEGEDEEEAGEDEMMAGLENASAGSKPFLPSNAAEDDGKGDQDSFLDQYQGQAQYSDEYEYRYSGGSGESGGENYDYDYYAYERNTSQGESGESGGEDVRRSYATDDYWYDYDDWPNYDDQYSAEAQDEEDLEEVEGEMEGDEDTLGQSPEETSPEKTSKDKSSSGNQKKVAGPVEMGKRSFRWFERKILAEQIPSSEENLRRKRLLEKCQLVRKVSKPVVNIFGPASATSKPLRSTDSGKVASISQSQKGSKQSVVEGDMMVEDDSKEDEEEEENSEPSRTFRDFSEREWALKNTIDFLTTQGCSTDSTRSYKSSLYKPREEADFRLGLYEHQLKRRRNAVANAKITDALQRHAERAVWRAVIDNTKPRYPLPRFILPRHKYLKKVQAQFIGPGSYEVDVYESMTKARHMRLPSTWATCTARFPKDKEELEAAKGGGSGGTVLLDPWTTLDEANLRHKYPGKCVPFESTPKNFRKGMSETGSRVPPNAYNIKSPLEEYIKKVTSLRGPYDCYTPPRGVIPYGYHKSQNDEEKGRLGPGSYEIRTSLVKEMHDSYNFFKGKFCKAEREKMFGFKAAFDNPLWPKDDGGAMPAVGQYDPDTELIGADKEQYMAPFMIQAGLKKRDPKKPDLTAPDYYYYSSSATWTVPPKGANLASVFRSKTPQILPPKLFAVRKERNKSSNKKIDLEGLGQGFLPEEHYAYDTPVKHAYVLEDCKEGPCRGGPRVDPFAIPGYGVGPESCCGGAQQVVITRKGGCGGCCGAL